MNDDHDSVAVSISIDSFPELDCAGFVTRFPSDLGSMQTPESWQRWFQISPDGASAPPVSRCEETQAAVRGLLRHGGYKPTGRGKPASEYLIRAAEPEGLRSINPAVDACNIVSLHSGLPISVVDLDLCKPPYRIGPSEPAAEYVFNPTGQTIQLKGLLCLHDAEGPCANAVKDSQRTKTSDSTQRALSVIWGTERLPSRTRAALDWYRALLADLGCTTETVVGPNS